MDLTWNESTRHMITKQNTKQMYATVEIVTPDDARIYLASSEGNRTIRSSRTTKLSSDMKQGRFFLSPHGICFSTSDALVDGHHRLTAQLQADVPVTYFVVRNVSSEVLPYLDSGMPRSARDALAMAGLGDYSTHMIQTAKALETYPSRSVDLMSPRDVLDVIERHAEALEFSCSITRTHKAGVSRPIRALVARAWYTESSERLREFVSILYSGMPVDVNHDVAAIVLRNYLLANVSGNTASDIERYAKGQTMLRAFCKKKKATKVYGTDDDLYPLPEDKA